MIEWFADYTRVHFGGMEKAFDVSSVFCEFSLFGKEVSIKWYGVIIAFGFILAALFGGRIAYTWKMNLSKMVDVLIYGTFGGIIGARAYACWKDLSSSVIRLTGWPKPPKYLIFL